MNKIIFSSLLCTALFMTSSCNNEGRENSKVSTENVEVNGDFVFEIEGVFPTNDRFQLFYSNDTNFTEENSVKVNVYGQNVMQKVTFVLPENAKPQNIRLDLGANADNTTISIKEFKMLYNGNELVANDEKIRDYFPDTESVVFDPVKLVYNLKPNAAGIFDPIVYSGDNLKRSLNQLYNQSKESK